jgi:hypothetical protein
MFDPRAGKLLFRTYAEEWLAGRRLAPMTRDSYEQTSVATSTPLSEKPR